MSYSGLIYAAIVACWAAVLVPRWIRRNEEVERAHEEDAARGVRVLERRQAHARQRAGRLALSGAGFPFVTPTAGVRSNGLPDDGPRTRSVLNSDAAFASDEPSPGGNEAADPHEFDVPSFGIAARRRRRVLALLLIALGVVTLAVAAGRLPLESVTLPAVLLSGFLLLARRAAVAEARRRDRMHRVLARRRAEAQAQKAAAVDPDVAGRRIAVLNLPEPAEPPDPNAWEPVPVPLPTYLTKAKAEAPVIRKIDLSSPGAWTSGRLNPAGSIALPPPGLQEDDDLPEQRRAVGG